MPDDAPRPTGLPAPAPDGSHPLPADAYTGQVVLVTGGGTGLGRAIAVEFARVGATVAVVSRSPVHVAAGAEAVRGVGGTAVTATCDVRDPASVAAAFDTVIEAAGLPDVLVNNAAGNFPVAAESLSPNGWRAVTSIVLDGTFHCSREFGTRHLAAGTPGSILNIGASYAWTGGPGFVHSAAAKAGVDNLTRTLAVEWAPFGIRVNTLVPGLMPHADETDDIRGVPGRGELEDQRSPGLRVGAPRELGWAATFLASPWATYVTGHTMVVDGANWQRRAMTQPPFTPIAEELGRSGTPPRP